MSQAETSLIFVKPEVAMQPAAAASLLEEFIAEKSLAIIGFKRFRMAEGLARKHYAEHEEKPFFPKLLAQVQAGPIIAAILRGPGAVAKIRALAGATFVEKATPASIRGKYGIIRGLNALHASDSPTSGDREVALWKAEGGLAEGGAAAEKELKAYIKKWKGKGENCSPAIRALAQRPLDNERREKIRALYVTAGKGSDITPAEIDKLLGVVDESARE